MKYTVDFSDVQDHHVHWAPLLKDKNHTVRKGFNYSENISYCEIIDERTNDPVYHYAVAGHPSKPSFETEGDCDAWIKAHRVEDYFFAWGHIRLAVGDTPEFRDNVYAQEEKDET